VRVDLFLKDSGEPIGTDTLREGEGVDFDGFDPEDGHEARVRKMFDNPLGGLEGVVIQYGEPSGEPQERERFSLGWFQAILRSRVGPAYRYEYKAQA
jgi:hypothetical protein